jgi:hypothetical protein
MRVQRTVVDAPTESDESDASTRLAWRRIDAEDEINAVLSAPRVKSEQHDAEFRRKEHELGDIFARLSAVDSLELQRRFALRLPDDELANRFAQLASDRRARLIEFLMSVRRRFAVMPRAGSDE